MDRRRYLVSLGIALVPFSGCIDTANHTPTSETAAKESNVGRSTTVAQSRKGNTNTTPTDGMVNHTPTSETATNESVDGRSTTVAQNRKESTNTTPTTVYIKNTDNKRHQVLVSVTQQVEPECLKQTPSCGMPNKEIRHLENTFIVMAGCEVGIPDVSKEPGSYQVVVDVMNGGKARETWTVKKYSNTLTIEITDAADVNLRYEIEK